MRNHVSIQPVENGFAITVDGRTQHYVAESLEALLEVIKKIYAKAQPCEKCSK